LHDLHFWGLPFSGHRQIGFVLHNLHFGLCRFSGHRRNRSSRRSRPARGEACTAPHTPAAPKRRTPGRRAGTLILGDLRENRTTHFQPTGRRVTIGLLPLTSGTPPNRRFTIYYSRIQSCVLIIQRLRLSVKQITDESRLFLRHGGTHVNCFEAWIYVDGHGLTHCERGTAVRRFPARPVRPRSGQALQPGPGAFIALRADSKTLGRMGNLLPMRIAWQLILNRR
jgi:hypothetical protein